MGARFILSGQDAAFLASGVAAPADILRNSHPVCKSLYGSAESPALSGNESGKASSARAPLTTRRCVFPLFGPLLVEILRHLLRQECLHADN
jgi:hypothetical protein